MKEWLLQGYGLYMLAALGVVGILARGVVYHCLRHMISQTERGNSSQNRILRQIKSRFENIYRINHGIDQMEVFVQKQIYLLRFFGMRLGTWKVISDQMLLAVLLCGLGIGVFCWNQENSMQAVRYLLFTATTVMVQVFCYLWTDITRRERELLVTLQDYLGNTYTLHLSRASRKDELVENTGAEQTGAEEGAKQQKTEQRRFERRKALRGEAALAQEQIAAAKVEQGPVVRPGKPAGKDGKRILTAEESKLIEEILQEYLQ